MPQSTVTTSDTPDFAELPERLAGSARNPRPGGAGRRTPAPPRVAATARAGWPCRSCRPRRSRRRCRSFAARRRPARCAVGGLGRAGQQLRRVQPGERGVEERAGRRPASATPRLSRSWATTCEVLASDARRPEVAGSEGRRCHVFGADGKGHPAGTGGRGTPHISAADCPPRQGQSATVSREAKPSAAGTIRPRGGVPAAGRVRDDACGGRIRNSGPVAGAKPGRITSRGVRLRFRGGRCT